MMTCNDRTITGILVTIVVASILGCEPVGLKPGPAADNCCGQLLAYMPEKIEIVGLTEFNKSGETKDRSKLKVYIDLLDGFGSQIKAPGVLRFELYEYVPRSAEAKGRRTFIWPDIDLTEPQANHSRWREFLRSYEFDLELNFRPQKNRAYILQANYIGPSGKRLSGDFEVKYK